ncbi:hypothetical protein [Candidatus Nanosynbacter lyticus]|uniref:hypothetical protein n=1 Tax=Candidatus Nanosynbacter lyticus TaxID=2093824 RepID=UPI002556C34D|nr:hypothetical protein [Candidatus Nanosynbacter lyticus]
MVKGDNMGLSEFFGIKKIDKTRVYAPDGGADLFVDSALREWDLDDTPAERELSEESRDLHDKLFAEIMRCIEEGEDYKGDQELIKLIRASINRNVQDDRDTAGS